MRAHLPRAAAARSGAFCGALMKIENRSAAVEAPDEAGLWTADREVPAGGGAPAEESQARWMSVEPA
eukprot:scaffold23449_cov131-Isochrysis_galbana.AAC.1